ncbi:histidine kinase [Kiritimatiellaeota bacterium B1221]|nr:histidine kinase [Kiritimatiellaeota bacterium B1221]
MKTFLFRIPVFTAASFSATAFPFILANLLWPDGLSANAANFFWPASGVNLALVLLWGKRYAPLILLNAMLAVVLINQPLQRSLIGASMNLCEVLIGSMILNRCQPITQSFDHLKTIHVLYVTSLITGLTNGILFCFFMVKTGNLPLAEFVPFLISIAMSNACGVMFLTPLILSFTQPTPLLKKQPVKTVAWYLAVLCISHLAFYGVFQNSLNYAFLTFPLMIYSAVKVPFSMLPRLLFLHMIAIYSSLIFHASDFHGGQTKEIIWFVQAASWTLTVTCLMLGALISENRNHEHKALQQEKDLLEGELLLERAHLKSLRYQINPHFLFNSLNSIYAVIPESLPAPRKMIMHLSSYFRSTLDVPSGDMISLSHEINRLEQYIEIEKARYGEFLKVEISIQPEVQDQMIPLFLLQPLVENAVRHGLEKSKEDFLLKITARVASPNYFFVEVSNPGFWEDDPNRNQPGIGLKNVKQRLSIIYAGEAGFEKRIQPNRISIRLRLPFTSTGEHPT